MDKYGKNDEILIIFVKVYADGKEDWGAAEKELLQASADSNKWKRVSDMKRDGRRKRLIILLIALLLKKRERTSEKGRVMSC